MDSSTLASLSQSAQQTLESVKLAISSIPDLSSLSNALLANETTLLQNQTDINEKDTTIREIVQPTSNEPYFKETFDSESLQTSTLTGISTQLNASSLSASNVGATSLVVQGPSYLSMGATINGPVSVLGNVEVQASMQSQISLRNISSKSQFETSTIQTSDGMSLTIGNQATEVSIGADSPQTQINIGTGAMTPMQIYIARPGDSVYIAETEPNIVYDELMDVKNDEIVLNASPSTQLAKDSRIVFKEQQQTNREASIQLQDNQFQLIMPENKTISINQSMSTNDDITVQKTTAEVIFSGTVDQVLVNAALTGDVTTIQDNDVQITSIGGKSTNEIVTAFSKYLEATSEANPKTLLKRDDMSYVKGNVVGDIVEGRVEGEASTATSALKATHAMNVSGTMTTGDVRGTLSSLTIESIGGGLASKDDISSWKMAVEGATASTKPLALAIENSSFKQITIEQNVSITNPLVTKGGLKASTLSIGDSSSSFSNPYRTMFLFHKKALNTTYNEIKLDSSYVWAEKNRSFIISDNRLFMINMLDGTILFDSTIEVNRTVLSFQAKAYSGSNNIYILVNYESIAPVIYVLNMSGSVLSSYNITSFSSPYHKASWAPSEPILFLSTETVASIYKLGTSTFEKIATNDLMLSNPLLAVSLTDTHILTVSTNGVELYEYNNIEGILMKDTSRTLMNISPVLATNSSYIAAATTNMNGGIYILNIQSGVSRTFAILPVNAPSNLTIKAIQFNDSVMDPKLFVLLSNNQSFQIIAYVRDFLSSSPIVSFLPIENSSSSLSMPFGFDDTQNKLAYQAFDVSYFISIPNLMVSTSQLAASFHAQIVKRYAFTSIKSDPHILFVLSGDWEMLDRNITILTIKVFLSNTIANITLLLRPATSLNEPIDFQILTNSLDSNYILNVYGYGKQADIFVSNATTTSIKPKLLITLESPTLNYFRLHDGTSNDSHDSLYVYPA